MKIQSKDTRVLYIAPVLRYLYPRLRINEINVRWNRKNSDKNGNVKVIRNVHFSIIFDYFIKSNRVKLIKTVHYIIFWL